MTTFLVCMLLLYVVIFVGKAIVALAYLDEEQWDEISQTGDLPSKEALFFSAMTAFFWAVIFPAKLKMEKWWRVLVILILLTFVSWKIWPPPKS